MANPKLKIAKKLPCRIQLARKKGWRLPKNTVVVSRPSLWGNPYAVGKEIDGILTMSNEHAVQRFREEAESNLMFLIKVRSELRGKNLACWCKLDDVCHADVLLEIANHR